MHEIMVRSGEASGGPWVSLLALLPHLLWATIVLGVLWWVGRDTIRTLLARVNKVSVAGVELELRDDLQAAAKDRGLTLGNDALGRAVRRLIASRAIVEGARLLWVDDIPASIVKESRLLEDAGAVITRALSSTEAIDKLDRGNFDLVISDIKLGEDPDAGTKFADNLAGRPNPPPLIFYVSTVLPEPVQNAFGITARPDVLLHLVLDVLARERS
jgi:CheY-like chemotaxis protein